MNMHSLKTSMGQTSKKFLSVLGIGLLVMLTTTLATLVIGTERVSAAETSAKLTCLSFDNGQPEAYSMTVGENVGNEESYAGGYPVFSCLGGQDMVVRPNAPANTVHSVTATCPTATPVIEERTTNMGSFDVKYVVARCNPPGEALTLAVQDPPGIPATQYSGTYAFENAPGETCPPNCGIPPPVLDPQCAQFSHDGTTAGVEYNQCLDDVEQYGKPIPPQVRVICDRISQDSRFEDFDVEACIAEVGRGTNPDLYREAVGYWCTLQTALSDGDTAQQETQECLSESYTLAGFTEAGGVPGEGEDPGNNPVCESTGFDLSWIFCPLINGMAEAADFMFDQIIRPLLQTPGVDVEDSEDKVFKVWSAFRNIANILLVVAMLVVVFGQTIGGGLIDAYNAKKILPRILAAAILVNISLYLVAFMVDVTNIVAIGLSDLIYSPFSDAEEFKFKLGNGSQALGFGAIVAGVFAGVAAGGAVVGLVGAAVPMFLLFVLLPAVLAFIGIVVTLIVRRGLIIFLILVSPIAFVLFCLPGTEKYFRKWWELLAKTLLVYPIIMAIFAIADVMAVTVNWGASTGPLTATVGNLISIALLVIPLFLIPFAFKLAGGAIGSLYAAIGGFNKRGAEAIKGDIRDPNSMRNMAKSRWQGKSQGAREDIVQTGIRMNKDQSGFKKRFGGGLARVAGGGNYEIRRSLRNKALKEMRQSHTDTGADNLVRGVFAKQMDYIDKDGNKQTGWFGIDAAEGDESRGQRKGFAYDSDGNVMSSSKFSDYEVAQSRRLYGQDASSYQAALEYEIGKAGQESEYNEMLSRHLTNMDSLGFSKYSADGTLIGANFAMQNAYKDGKHTKYAKDKSAEQRGTSLPAGYERKRREFSRDVAENVSNWGLSNMKAHTIDALTEDYQWADAVKNGGEDHKLFTNKDGTRMSSQEIADYKAQHADEATEVMKNIRTTADSLNMRYQKQGNFAAEGEGAEVVSGAQTGAAGRVNEAIGKLVSTAKTPEPTRTPPPPQQGTDPRGYL